MRMWRDLSAPGNWSAGAVWGDYEIEPNKEEVFLTAVKHQVRLSIHLGKLPAAETAPPKIILQAATLGRKSVRLVRRQHGAERLLWHGLAAEATEALAEWCSQRAAAEMGWERWRRMSPGFPAWPELSEQRQLFRLLRPGKFVIRLKRSLMMDPEYSTTAALIPI